MGYLYRYHEHHYEDGDLQIYLQEFPIARRTKCGVWIPRSGYLYDYDDGHKQRMRFVNLTYMKKYACATIEEARSSYIRRKRRQIAILGSQLNSAELALKAALDDKWEQTILVHPIELPFSFNRED